MKHGFLSSESLLIKPSQVVAIDKEKMIVEDAILKNVEKQEEMKVKRANILANISQIKQE